VKWWLPVVTGHCETQTGGTFVLLLTVLTAAFVSKNIHQKNIVDFMGFDLNIDGIIWNL
jgi:hypothetical protein